MVSYTFFSILVCSAFLHATTFVYHAENIENEGFIKVVKVMEMKIYKYIGVPAMYSTVITGGILAYYVGFSGNDWLYAKIFLVALLVAYFYSMGHFRQQFLDGTCTKSGKYFRIYNEIPTLLILLIAGMVIFKPF